jgi:hypothetical protein
MSIECDSRLWHCVVDDVTYRMVALEADNRFFVSWMCIRCVELAGSTLRGATRDEAIERATVRIADHHELFHRGNCGRLAPNQKMVLASR